MNRPQFQNPAGRDRTYQHLTGGGSCDGNCGSRRFRGRARTRPFPLGVNAAAVITYNSANVTIPSGSKLRITPSQGAVIASISIDGQPLGYVNNLPAASLDPAIMLADPEDFILPEIQNNVTITFSAPPANPIYAYLTNVPFKAIGKCDIADDGADVQAASDAASATVSLG